jgi:hypothetical protein
MFRRSSLYLSLTILGMLGSVFALLGCINLFDSGKHIMYYLGPGIWFSPIGFLLSLVCYSFLLFQEVKARKRARFERSQNEIIEPGSFI